MMYTMLRKLEKILFLVFFSIGFSSNKCVKPISLFCPRVASLWRRAIHVITNSSTNKVNDSTHMLVHSIPSIWHIHLGHANYKRLKEMYRLGLVPNFDGNIEKCKTCMLIKIIKSCLPNFEMITKQLELIHGDLDDYHNEGNTMSYSVMIFQDVAKCVFCMLRIKH